MSLPARAAGYALPIVGVAAVTATCVALRDHVNATTAALARLLMVLLAAMVWGSLPAFVASIVAMLCFNFHFLPPIGTFTIADPQNWAALGAFFITAAAVGQLSARVKRRAADARMLAHLQAVLANLGQRALQLMRSVDIRDEAVHLVADTLGVEYANLMELLPDGTSFVLRAGVGWGEGQVGRAIVVREGSQPGFTIASDRVVSVENAAKEVRFVPSARYLGQNVESTLSVVVPTPQGPYGSLGAHTRHRRTFTRDEVNFLQSVANVLGAAIERERNERRLRQLNQSFRALSNCNALLISRDR